MTRRALMGAALASRYAFAQDILTVPPPKADARIAYGSDMYQFGDLRLPPGAGPHPLVIFIHGGFWRAAYDLNHAGHLCAALTHAGAATWSIEYRRIGNPGGGWTGTFDDVLHGSEHARVLARKYPIDLDRTVASGHSAGGQLVLWLAAQRAISLRSVVPLAAVSDLRRAWDLQLSGGVVAQLLGGTPQQVPNRYAASSPVDLLPISVAQRVVHGTADQVVPFEMSRHFTQLSHNSRLVGIEGAGHFDLIDPRSAAWPTVQKSIVEGY